MKKTILSFDVGIKNLAYCLIEKTGDDFNILKWNVINLVSDQQKCMHELRGGKGCTQDAKFSLHHKDGENVFSNNSNNIFVCKTHKEKASPLIKEIENKKTKTKKLQDVKKCMHCDNESKYELTTNINYSWCEGCHKKSSKIIDKKIGSKKVNNVACGKQPVQDISEKLYAKLDEEIMNNPDVSDFDEVIIENQPGMKNRVMSRMGGDIRSYFTLRGVIDGKKNIKFVNFVSPSNKLKVDKKTTNDLLDKEKSKNEEKDKTKKDANVYKLTKNLGVKYCMSLIEDKDKDILNKLKKKDDLCDAFLQGFQYLFSPVPEKYMDMLRKCEEKIEKN